MSLKLFFLANNLTTLESSLSNIKSATISIVDISWFNNSIGSLMYWVPSKCKQSVSHLSSVKLTSSALL